MHLAQILHGHQDHRTVAVHLVDILVHRLPVLLIALRHRTCNSNNDDKKRYVEVLPQVRILRTCNDHRNGRLPSQDE